MSDETTLQDVFDAIEAGGWSTEEDRYSPPTLSTVIRVIKEASEFQEEVWNDDYFREQKFDELKHNLILPFFDILRDREDEGLMEDFQKIVEGFEKLMNNATLKDE